MLKENRTNFSSVQVLALLGSITFEPAILDQAGKGGPLGEVIQWTDLIAALYMLGHDVVVITDDWELT